MIAKDVLVRIVQSYALKYVEKIAKNSTNDLPKIDSPKNIIFNRVYTIYAFSTFEEVGIAKALQLMGHKVKFYICGGKLWNCSSVFTMKNPPNRLICKNCINFGKNLLRICNIPFETYEKATDGRDHYIQKYSKDLESFRYKGVLIGDYVRDATNRFFKGMNPDKTKYSYEEIFKERFRNALISVDVAEYSYKNDKPDVLYTSHGCYSEWGGFTDYFISKNVKRVLWDYVYGRNYIFNTHDFRTKIYPEYREKYKTVTDDEKNELYDYLSRRMAGKTDTSVYRFNPYFKSFDDFSSEYSNVFGMFPNVPWDTSLVRSDKVFKNVYEWVDYTINFFKNNPDKLLIIKIHPAEISDGSFATLKDYIKENHKLTSNIKIIDAKTKISAYNLLSVIDVGIVYNGTIGLEMSILGIPVILCGLSHYHGNGFTYDIVSKEHYCSLLENPPKKLNENMRSLAENYGYFYFIRSNIPISYVIHKNKFLITFDVNKFEELLSREEIAKACKYITDNVLFQEIR